ncbi:hypothetical protein Sjap_026008 [Stephania japonica]|uniref:Cytochrome P450 n=1 Tax=Stephania japonica TaxID=461633 RepID=A0AAP0E679_9MAGN
MEDALMIVGTVLLLVLLMLLLDQTFLWSAAKQQWPAGPKRLPLVGNLHKLNRGGKPLHVTLSEMAGEHGGMMTVWFGGQQPTIVLSDRDLVWEVMVNKATDFGARSLPKITKIFTADWGTLATCELGDHWQTLRKGLQSCAINPLTISSQSQLQEKDIADLITSLEHEASLNDGVVEPLPKLRKLVIRLMARFCFGREFPNEDHFVEELDLLMLDEGRLMGHTRFADVFSFTRYVPGLWGPFIEAENLKRRIKELIRPYLIGSTNKTTHPINCFMSFLVSQGLPEEVVIFNLFDLFSLAGDSTSNTLAWALGFIIHNEEVQERMYKEIMNHGKLSKMRNMVSTEEVSTAGMEYVHAVVKETMRMRPAVVLAPVRASADSELEGLKIRGGTAVMLNLYAVHHDEKAWKQANKFMPERFIDQDAGGWKARRGLLFHLVRGEGFVEEWN